MKLAQIAEVLYVNMATTCISMAGLLDVKTLTGTTILHFCAQEFTTASVVIMDNCHIPEVVKPIQDVGTLVPLDFTPIEETFSKVQQSLEKDINDIETLLLLGFFLKIAMVGSVTVEFIDFKQTAVCIVNQCFEVQPIYCSFFLNNSLKILSSYSC